MRSVPGWSNSTFASRTALPSFTGMKSISSPVTPKGTKRFAPSWRTMPSPATADILDSRRDFGIAVIDWLDRRHG